jgi:rod shape-determining protein MreD
MVDASTGGRWRYRLLFLMIVFLLCFVQLLPLEVDPGRIPGPDVMLLLAMAWVLRRPEYVPVTLVAGIFLLADVLFMRPLGLWTAIVILGLEFLRARSVAMRDWSFFVEWLTVASMITVMYMVNTLVLTIFLVDDAPLGLVLLRLIATILAYPLVVALGARAMGLRKIVPGEVDGLGQRQ